MQEEVSGLTGSERLHETGIGFIDSMSIEELRIWVTVGMSRTPGGGDANLPAEVLYSMYAAATERLQALENALARR